jgi:uncharacterized SAM-binding protein YcdF (DUF218 family)
MKKIRRLLKLLMWLGLALLLWCTWAGWRILRGSEIDETRTSDAAIVLGAAAYGDRPSPVFEQRILHAVDLYRKKTVRKLLFTGGFGDGAEMAESQVARRYAMELGVPDRDMLIEKSSRTTLENLQQARTIMQQQGLTTALIVSDPLHMERAAWMARHLEIDARRSPTPTSKYKSPESRSGFLLREIYALTAWFVGGV